MNLRGAITWRPSRLLQVRETKKLETVVD